MIAAVAGSSRSSDCTLIFTYPESAAVTSGSFSVVLSIVKQFLHQVAQRSSRTGLLSRSASASPTASDECQPLASISLTEDETSVASADRSSNNV